MYQRALILALMAAGVVLPGTSRAADDCTQMFVYSVNQFCRTLSNGFSQCQPVGMVGPAPNCAKPGVPPIMPVPLAPPVVQAPSPYNYMSPFPAPGVMAPAAAVQPNQAAPVTAPVAAAKPAAPAPVATPVAAAPSAPVAAVAPTPAPTSAPAPVAAVTPAPRQEPAIAPVTAPVAATSAAPVAAKVETAPPAAVPVSPVPVTVAAPVTAPVAPPAQPAPVASAPVASSSPAVEPAMPPSITLQDGLAHFGFDRAELSGQSRAELDAWLKQPLPKGKTLRVTGHADRLGPAPYNLKLSGRRAETVKKYLVDKGMAGKDIKVFAKGESEPVKHCKGGATKATIACLAPNRRVEIDPE